MDERFVEESSEERQSRLWEACLGGDEWTVRILINRGGPRLITAPDTKRTVSTVLPPLGNRRADDVFLLVTPVTIVHVRCVAVQGFTALHIAALKDRLGVA